MQQTPITNSTMHEMIIPVETPAAIRLSDVLGALSHALDLTEGQPEGHALRTCIIGMRIAKLMAVLQREAGVRL